MEGDRDGEENGNGEGDGDEHYTVARNGVDLQEAKDTSTTSVLSGDGRSWRPCSAP